MFPIDQLWSIDKDHVPLQDHSSYSINNVKAGAGFETDDMLEGRHVQRRVSPLPS